VALDAQRAASSAVAAAIADRSPSSMLVLVLHFDCRVDRPSQGAGAEAGCLLGRHR